MNTKEYQYSNSQKTYVHTYLRPIFKKVLLRLKNKTFQDSKPRSLDMGCGNGEFCNFMHTMGFDATGIDSSSKGIHIAKSNFPKALFMSQCKF